jgi:DNA-binding GntR family transcriptional regulator
LSQDELASARRHLDEHVAAFVAGDVDRAIDLHAGFHFLLYTAAGSHWLPRLIRPLWENSERYVAASLVTGGDFEKRRREHERILAACARRDPEGAAAALSANLAHTANLVARAMGHRELF